MTPQPATYTEGLGELVRAHRLYCALSQRTFAERLGMKERALSDIEIGRRPCPPGLLDSVERVVDAFDADVDRTGEAAEQMVGGASTGDVVHLDVNSKGIDEWARSVIGRAAVQSGMIVPTLVGEHAPREAVV